MELNQQPLNQAHYFQRQAEKSVLRGDLAQALLFFKKAAHHFEISCDGFFQKTVDSAKDDFCYSPYIRALTYIPPDCCLTFQTILEQKEFCRRQAEILETKINKTMMEKEPTTNFENLSNLSFDTKNFEDEKSKKRILQNFQRHDTLLHELGLCQVKNDQNLVEELQQANRELKICILKLFDLLDEKNREIENLKKIDKLDETFKNQMNLNNREDIDLTPKPDLIMDFTPLELPEYKPPVLP